MKVWLGLSGRNQVQWAVLLAIAVLLPTASLLWFMRQVIANERLVVRQKLAALYQDKLADAAARTEARFADRLKALDRPNVTSNPYALFRPLILAEGFEAVVLRDATGGLVYPRPAEMSGNDVPAGHPLAEAWRKEFAAAQPVEAAQFYAELTGHRDQRIALTARLGRSRSLAKAGKVREAIAECQLAAFDELPRTADPELRITIENARLLLLSLIGRSGDSREYADVLDRTVAALNADLFNTTSPQALLPPNHNLFIAGKVLAATNVGTASRSDLKDLAKLSAAEALSFAAAEVIPAVGTANELFPVTVDSRRLFALRHRNGSSLSLLLLGEKAVAGLLDGYREAFGGSVAAYQIIGPGGELVAGKSDPGEKPFVSAALPAGFPGWKVSLYFEGGDVFEQAARRQIAVYVWTGALVIVLILVAGAFATRAVGRQIRLNRMKNDFIATVSHELKTPLASMRVLVDTLLEDRIRDREQGREYLGLIAKENERLSRMIDNFLTFSRMERNKISFTLTEARPAAIVHDAVESLKTKMAGHHCHLSVELADELPEIQADHDAIVTVLVNLLDNACKYTTDNKQVALKVFQRDAWVYFTVADNGIGLARRHLRKVFDRFYQVDNSLARKTEGCGLGLSIVKFIVDAHEGKITVESRPGLGSTFTVRLPVGRKNGN